MQPPRVLFVLQNAWRRGAVPGELESDHEPRAWERGLWRSQTGKRLREMIPDDLMISMQFEVVNASLRVGSHSTAVFAADSLLMHARMQRIQPDFVVLLGKVAEKLAPVVASYNRPCIIGPQPAWRLLSKVRTAELKEEIETMRSNL